MCAWRTWDRTKQIFLSATEKCSYNGTLREGIILSENDFIARRESCDIMYKIEYSYVQLGVTEKEFIAGNI